MTRFLSEPHKPIEAEASVRTTVRKNGTGCGSTELAEVRAKARLRRCAIRSKVRTGVERCASWKTPWIPSKMRTLFQGAHENCAPSHAKPEKGPQPIRACLRKEKGEAEISHGFTLGWRALWSTPKLSDAYAAWANSFKWGEGLPLKSHWNALPNCKSRQLGLASNAIRVPRQFVPAHSPGTAA
jgi:hypothetical protein